MMAGVDSKRLQKDKRRPYEWKQEPAFLNETGIENLSPSYNVLTF